MFRSSGLNKLCDLSFLGSSCMARRWEHMMTSNCSHRQPRCLPSVLTDVRRVVPLVNIKVLRLVGRIRTGIQLLLGLEQKCLKVFELSGQVDRVVESILWIDLAMIVRFGRAARWLWTLGKYCVGAGSISRFSLRTALSYSILFQDKGDFEPYNSLAGCVTVLGC